MIVNGNLKFHTLGSGELQNAIMERLAGADPAGVADEFTTTPILTLTDSTMEQFGQN